MFGFFASQEKKMRENAANWLELATKIYHYRRDVLAPVLASELLARKSELQALVKERAGAEKLKIGIERLEDVMQKSGGAHYPKSALVENVEFFLVAALVILGIRTYFIQPFKIPTNSMWPTYNGMTPEVFKTKAEEPAVPAVAARLVAFGAWPHRLDAPGDGEVLVPVYGRDSRGAVASRKVPGRTWLVIPAEVREYTIFVGEQPVKFRVPLDFDMDWVVSEAYLLPNAAFSTKDFRAEVDRRLGAGEFEIRNIDGERVRCIRTGRRVRTGERMLSFDELTGDNLFVDRVSYHFMRPKPGQGFVFRTGNIPGIAADYGDQYYIKRLVGTPGDEIEIVPGKLGVDGKTVANSTGSGVLLRNGRPIEGADAFHANNGQIGKYTGYQPYGLLSFGTKAKIPEHRYLALGDNSGNSADGRYWGFVPAKDVVGRPMMVYYPLTKHWGPAQ